MFSFKLMLISNKILQIGPLLLFQVLYENS